MERHPRHGMEWIALGGMPRFNHVLTDIVLGKKAFCRPHGTCQKPRVDWTLSKSAHRPIRMESRAANSNPVPSLTSHKPNTVPSP